MDGKSAADGGRIIPPYTGRVKPRTFRSPADEALVEFACAILEQAVLDWELCGRGKWRIGRSPTGVVERDELMEFFASDWLDALLSVALPQFTPEEILEALGLEIQ